MAKVLVIADIKQGVLKGSTAQLLSKAKAIGAETAVVAIGCNIESLIPGLVTPAPIRNISPMIPDWSCFQPVPTHPVSLTRPNNLAPT